MRSHKKLFNKIEKFLENKKKSAGGGSWPEVTKDEVGQLKEIFQNIIDKKYDRDYSGSSVINFEIVNRKTHEQLWIQPIPHHASASPTSILHIAEYNACYYNSRLHQLWNIYRGQIKVEEKNESR